MVYSVFVFYLNTCRKKVSVGTFKKIQDMKYIIILDGNCINLTVEACLHCIQYIMEKHLVTGNTASFRRVHK